MDRQRLIDFLNGFGKRFLALRKENEQLQNQNMALRQRNRELVTEVMQKSAEVSEYQEKSIRLQTEIDGLEAVTAIKYLSLDEQGRMLIGSLRESDRLRMLVDIHMKQTEHNLCWGNDLQLWREVFKDPTIEYPHSTIPPEGEFVEVGCEEFCKPFYHSRFNPIAPPRVPRMPKNYLTPKVFLICPVRLSDSPEDIEIRSKVEAYVARLEAQGYVVHYPTRDTKQDDPTGGYRICQDNFKAIIEADEIHIWYNESSQGSKFDMGGVFMLYMLHDRTSIVVANDEEVVEDSRKQKSFLKVMRYLQK